MTFTARIRRNSAIWQMWRQQHRVGGVVDGVAFRWVPGDDYVSGPLVPDRVPAMQRHTDVVVEGAEVMPVNPILTEALGLRPLDDPDDVPLRTRRPARGAGRLGLSQVSGNSNPGQYSIVPTQALWGWSTPASGQAPVVATYPPYGSPTKSGVLPSDVQDFLGIPLQLFTTPPTPISDATVIGWIRMIEDDIETDTNIRLCQTWIAAPPAKSAYATSAVGLGVSGVYQQLGVDYDYPEAPYDFHFARWRDEGWGFMRLRWRPVKSIETFAPASDNYDPTNLTGVKNMSFIYPLLNEFFRMPISWLVEDQNRGLIRAVPATNVQMLPLFAMQLAFMGFAESVPGGLWYQYTAGLTANDYNANWAFMRQLVLAKTAVRALRAMQLSRNLGVVESQTTADGLAYRQKFSEKGAFYGQIREFEAEAKMLTRRAKMMGGGVVLGII